MKETSELRVHFHSHPSHLGCHHDRHQALEHAVKVIIAFQHPVSTPPDVAWQVSNERRKQKQNKKW